MFQTFGIILTIGMRAMMNNVSTLGANITICVVLLLGTIITGNSLNDRINRYKMKSLKIPKD